MIIILLIRVLDGHCIKIFKEKKKKEKKMKIWKNSVRAQITEPFQKTRFFRASVSA